MSEFACPIVEIRGFRKHPNADTLCVTDIEGAVCIFKEGALEAGSRAVFIPVDALVPLDNPAFAFLRDTKRPDKTHARVKAKRLRGVFSDGLLIPVFELSELRTLPRDGIPSDLAFADENGTRVYRLGADVSRELGIVKAEDVVPPTMRGNQAPTPDGVPVYDMENWKKYRHVFKDGENVVVTEKIHGTNSRFCLVDGKLSVGSHRCFLKEDERNVWWRVARETNLELRLQDFEARTGRHIVLFGEVFGDVQDLKYGCRPGEVRFSAFDAYDLDERRYVDYDDFDAITDDLDIPTVPVLYVGPYSEEIVKKFVEPVEGGTPFKSCYADNLREGVVIKPVKERWNEYTHRTIAKLVSEAYLLRKNGTELH